MENGLTIAKFLTYITLFLEKQIGERLGVNIDKLQTLKVSSSDPAKLYNWNILSQELEMLDINLLPEDKRDILQGNHNIIANLIMKMKAILHGDVDTNSLLNKSKEGNKTGENDENYNETNNQFEEEKPKVNLPKAAVDMNELNTDKNLNE